MEMLLEKAAYNMGQRETKNRDLYISLSVFRSKFSLATLDGFVVPFIGGQTEENREKKKSGEGDSYEFGLLSKKGKREEDKRRWGFLWMW